MFALGDATDLPTSKAGSVTHFEAEVLTENIARYLADEELEAGYDGHANCFIETGFHKALLIDFNYETEPLPGHFPSVFGLPLLRESRLNHIGKLACGQGLRQSSGLDREGGGRLDDPLGRRVAALRRA